MGNNWVVRTAIAVCVCAAPALAQRGHGAFGHSMHSNHFAASTSRKAAPGKKTPEMMLQRNRELSLRVASMLPRGTNLQTAASGFKNLGQFVAAVHVADNIGVPFDMLKSKMVGPHRESMGKAIQQLRSDVNAKEEAKRGDREAKADIYDTQS